MHIRDHIEELRSKPEHIRRRIALGASLGITGLVFVGWLTALTSTAPTVLSSKSENDPALTDAVSQTSSSFSALLGAVNAAQSVSQNANGLYIVDTRASSTLDTPDDSTEGKTVIPF